MRMIYAVAVLVLALPVLRAAGHDESTLATALKEVAEKSVEAYDAKNIDDMLRYVHTKSPEYERTREQLAVEFKIREVRAELVKFRYIGHDDEFAVARIKFKTVAPGNDEFQDNIVDSLTVFHQEDGVWKFWSDYILGVELIE